MFRRLLFAFVAACSACGASSGSTPPPAATEPPAAPGPTDTPAPAPEPNALADAVDALFADAAAKDAFSGSVIVVDGGKEVLAKGYGSANRKAQRQNTPDTIFRIGSVSKQFTAAAVLALVKDGKLALTDPVSKYFPDYPTANLTKDGVAVTVHHLISHTSGLPDPRTTPGFRRAVWNRVIDPSEQVGFAMTLPLVSKPGSEYAYVNFNFLLAALIVEKVSGQAYASFLRARFFEPLGMKDTGTLLPADAAERAALGYYDDDGTRATLTDDPTFKDREVSFAFGSGQIYSTVKDLARWDRALAGESILPAAQRDLLFKPNLDDYGYGWVIQKKNGVSIEWHNGAISPLGFTALVVRVPSKDRFVAYLSNLDLALVQPFESKVEALAVK